MKVIKAYVGSTVVDSLPYSNSGTAKQAMDLKASGVSALCGYLGAMNPTRLRYVIDAGLGFMPVTFGGEYKDGPLDELAQLKALGIPLGASVWLDMEGLEAFKTDPAKLIAMIAAWSAPIEAAGYMPCLYVGAPQPLTSQELWKLPVRRYWLGQGRCVDRFGALAMPWNCGWSMTQVFPSVNRNGVLVDCNMVGCDFLGRVPTMVVA